MNSSRPARLSLLFTCFMLAGCGSFDVKEKLGLNREGPDEYRVVPRPPLSVPPEFNLRPPGKESDYLSGLPAQDRAHDQVLGTGTGTDTVGGKPVGVLGASAPAASTAVIPVTSGALPSSGDAQFLANIHSDKSDPSVRQQLLDDKSNGTGEPKDSTYMFGSKDTSDPLVDAAKEKDRIKQDQATNQPVTTGDTPVIKPKDNGLLGDIF